MNFKQNSDRSIYLVRVNGSNVFETPWYSEAVHEYNQLCDNCRRGDFVTIWYIKDMDMPVWKDKNSTMLAGYRK